MYKIHYPSIPNMGDLLNKNMLEDLFGIKVIQAPPIKSNLSAIGSGLGATQWDLNPKLRIRQLLYYPFVNHDHYIWGTGFISYNQNADMPFFFRNMNFCSVRGNMTKGRVEKILGKAIDIPTGDGGLLADRWVGNVKKKYSIGIIPHYKEKDHPIIPELANNYSNSTVIDLAGEPKEVIKRIAECETILSSSLHGLIIADSYHIPNMHIQLYPPGIRMLGDGYKFADYYSSYGLKDNPIILENTTWPCIEEIYRRYLLDSDIVETKKDQIMKAFPKL